MNENRPSSDIAFTPAVKAIQAAKGSRQGYERMESSASFQLHFRVSRFCWNEALVTVPAGGVYSIRGTTMSSVVVVCARSQRKPDHGWHGGPTDKG